MTKEEWKKIGEVAVDSGQLMVCDPCYIDSEWKEEQFSREEKLKIVKTGEVIDGPNIEKGEKYTDEFQNMTWNTAIEEGILEEVPLKETHKFSYDGCCKGTINKDFSQLFFELGHPGAGVAFSSGFGDGVYGVYAKFKHFDHWGTKIVEVKIKLI